MKTLLILALALVSLKAQATVELEACPSRTLRIEVNVDGRTPKRQLVAIINGLATAPQFATSTLPSQNEQVNFEARLQSYCTGACTAVWADLQDALAKIQGVRVACVIPAPAGGRAPMPAPHAPPAPGSDPGQDTGGGGTQNPPPPGAGGVVGGN